MSTNTIPARAGDFNHLAAFKPSKHSINDDNLTLTDVEYDSDDEDYDNRMPIEVRPGDIILFFDGGHHGRLENLTYSQIVSIKTFVNKFGDSDADIGLSTHAIGFNINHNKVVVYRLDSSGVIQDVTHTRFMSMKDLTLIDGTIDAGTYVTDVDRFMTILNSKQQSYNERLVETGEIRSVEHGVDLRLNTTKVNSALAADEVALSSMMKTVIAQIKLRQREYTKLTDHLRAKKEKKMKALEDEREKRQQSKVCKDVSKSYQIIFNIRYRYNTLISIMFLYIFSLPPKGVFQVLNCLQ